MRLEHICKVKMQALQISKDVIVSWWQSEDKMEDMRNLECEKLVREICGVAVECVEQMKTKIDWSDETNRTNETLAKSETSA